MGTGGKGGGKSGKSRGKGKGKTKRKGLKVSPDKKVWIGNIPDGVTWKELQEHMNEGGKTKWVEVFRGKSAGTGVVAYATAEEAATAIANMNGTELGGAAITCDVWEKAEK